MARIREWYLAPPPRSEYSLPSNPEDRLLLCFNLHDPVVLDWIEEYLKHHTPSDYKIWAELAASARPTPKPLRSWREAGPPLSLLANEL